ncbi:hypothetical protein E2C01_000943 [Portunus trituberculatus]|uniref:Uncharacterized protein n=1 Tax=Portunus trituberculatus TaxID=210409 RepID=A0A5B7CFZ1_PORTR|nr:hypothetical protein [Portunus trituberculatus]
MAGIRSTGTITGSSPSAVMALHPTITTPMNQLDLALSLAPSRGQERSQPLGHRASWACWLRLLSIYNYPSLHAGGLHATRVLGLVTPRHQAQPYSSRNLHITATLDSILQYSRIALKTCTSSPHNVTGQEVGPGLEKGDGCAEEPGIARAASPGG